MKTIVAEKPGGEHNLLEKVRAKPPESSKTQGKVVGRFLLPYLQKHIGHSKGVKDIEIPNTVALSPMLSTVTI